MRLSYTITWQPIRSDIPGGVSQTWFRLWTRPLRKVETTDIQQISVLLEYNRNGSQHVVEFAIVRGHVLLVP